ncbi:MFS transporter [Kineococcus sp. SYSU DK003]|uniref:MFS transporter n=1 Tax=Kineococcus sp. SYSU DK003 TaxID=3383124 RepID=UPI003D7CC67D
MRADLTDAPSGPGGTVQPMTAGRAPTAPGPVGKKYLWGLALGQFGLYTALMSPVYVSMQLKAQEISSDAAGVIGAVMPVGALGALVANPIAGALSDRTRSRWGRRRPWMVGGVLLFLVALAWIGFAPDQLHMTLGWLLAQIAANATLATLTASFADNVPELQRGRASSTIALAQNVAVLAGTYLSVYLVANLPVLFILPGILAVVLIGVYCATARDEVPSETLPRLQFIDFVRTFWTNPLQHRDFGLAWWSRFLMILATFMFTTYRLLYMQDHLGMNTADATAAVAFGVLLYTIALMAAAALSGWLSDRLQRRKIFVGGSTLLFGVGLVVLARADDVSHFYLAEVVMGLAYGVYSAIDTALVVDVLPDPSNPGKDLGVFNMANALPQSLAPAIGVALLGIGSAANQNYELLCWGAGIVAAIGALVVIPIKKVR